MELNHPDNTNQSHKHSIMQDDIRRRHPREAGDPANPEKGPPVAAAVASASSGRGFQEDGGSNNKRYETLGVLWKMINKDRETAEFPNLEEGGLDQL